ncbi:MAG: tryptophan synthase subunit alpha [Candidatus Sumerlaeia bacterium]|nr:tryptophan synthase subunit alpha [Candidatus Sumerlaeia bacterium]
MTMTLPKNRIDSLFERTKKENRSALILYLTAGFPHPDHTLELLHILEQGGCDLVELGIPFSDPIADGPTIQRASTQALNNGMTFQLALEQLAEFRKSSALPVVLFGSINPFLRRGLLKTAEDAQSAGADGFLAADLPTEESAEFRGICHQHGLHLIPLVAPTTTNKRVEQISTSASGFVYCMSLKGITGARASLGDEVVPYMERVRQHTNVPIALGFGISTPEQIRHLAPTCDAIVVGSKLITTIEEEIAKGAGWENRVLEFVSQLAEACRY